MLALEGYDPVHDHPLLVQVAVFADAVRKDSGGCLPQKLKERRCLVAFRQRYRTPRVHGEAASLQALLFAPHDPADIAHVGDVQAVIQNRQPLRNAEAGEHGSHITRIDIKETYSSRDIREVHAAAIEPGGRRELTARLQQAAVAAPFTTAIQPKFALERGIRTIGGGPARDEQRHRQDERERPADGRERPEAGERAPRTGTAAGVQAPRRERRSSRTRRSGRRGRDRAPGTRASGCTTARRCASTYRRSRWSSCCACRRPC